MNRRGWMWLVTIVALCCSVALSAPRIGAQEPAAQAQGEQPEAAKSAGEEAVEEILRQQEALITGEGFTYNPEGRRDPFRSPFGGIGDPMKPRPAGIVGMMVTEIDLVGVINDPKGGDMAMVTGSDNKGYFLRVGDQVYDGTVIAIDPDQGTVTFRQKVDDPRMIKPYRDIVKRVVPLDDEESGDE
jgi:hypothetical protein